MAASADELNDRGVELHQDGLGREAEASLLEALRRDPRHLHATYNLDLLRWRQGTLRDDRLLAQLEAAAALEPGDADAPLLIGLVHAERGDDTAARESLELAWGRAGGSGASSS